MSVETVNAQVLLNYAKWWYQANAGEQIPLALWNEHVIELVPEINGTRIRLQVSEGEYAVEMPSAKIIPALAAISLGLNSSKIQAVALHHGIELLDLSNCRFSFIFKPGDANDRPVLSAWSVSKAMMRAFCHSREDDERFFGSVGSKILNPTQLVASLTVPRPAVWPVTGIRAHIQGARQGRVPHDTLLRPATSAENFSEAKIDIDSLSDDQFMELFERTGNLVVGATSENGFICSFFKDMLIEMALDREENHLRLVKVLNGLSDPQRIELVRSRIMEDLCDMPQDKHTSEGEYILENLELHLDHGKYGAMHENMLLKLNVVNVSQLDNFAKVITRAIPDCYVEFFDNGDQVLARLDSALAPIKPEEFKAPHFRALKVATDDWDRVQDIGNVDLKGLLLKSLTAFDIYTQQNHVDLKGHPQQVCKDNARHHLTTFATYALKHVDHDYKLFSTLSSDSKAVLAMAGLDITKLTGINIRDRGRVLYDQLGL